MRVLVACEFSGVVRDAFLARGHDAVDDAIPALRTRTIDEHVDIHIDAIAIESDHAQGPLRRIRESVHDLGAALVLSATSGIARGHSLAGARVERVRERQRIDLERYRVGALPRDRRQRRD